MPIIILSAIILYLAGAVISADFNLGAWAPAVRWLAAGTWLFVSAFWGSMLYLQGDEK